MWYRSGPAFPSLRLKKKNEKLLRIEEELHKRIHLAGKSDQRPGSPIRALALTGLKSRPSLVRSVLGPTALAT